MSIPTQPKAKENIFTMVQRMEIINAWLDECILSFVPWPFSTILISHKTPMKIGQFIMKLLCIEVEVISLGVGNFGREYQIWQYGRLKFSRKFL